MDRGALSELPDRGWRGRCFPAATSRRPDPPGAGAVTIPVEQQGRRMFFLGNVHGWSSHDPGTGNWGSVAQYVIQYADGQVQIVPLITGRTIDEWAAPPVATDVVSVLSGKRWHLNLLAVELQPKRVEQVVFRDLGTASAPVLLAVTIEK